VQAIADVGRRYFAALQDGKSLGPLEQVFQGKIPFKYAHCESEMTMAMHGQERIFQGCGKRREMQRVHSRFCVRSRGGAESPDTGCPGAAAGS
jgi:hypothetical protein